MKDIIGKIDFFLNEREWGKLTHPGILEVPENKNVMDLPDTHFIKLAKKKSKDAIVKALLNLYRWNKNDNPKLSKWAKDMQEKVSKEVE